MIFAPLHQNILWPGRSLTNQLSLATSATVTKLAQRIVLPQSISATGINIKLTKNSNPVGVNFVLHIQTESSGLPSGTDVTNATTSSFSPSSTGFVGVKSFGGTVSLSAKTPYWIVLEVSSSTTLDSTNNWSWNGVSDSGATSISSCWQSSTNNGSWAAVSVNRLLSFLLTLNDASVIGNPYTSATGTNRTVSGTTRVGLSFTLGTTTVVRGFVVVIGISSLTSLNDLEFRVYDGSDNAYPSGGPGTISGSVLYGSSTTTITYPHFLDFEQDVTLNAGTYYLSLHQASDGNTSNYRVATITSDYSDESLTRGGLVNRVYTRTSDVGSWTAVSSTFEDAVFGPVIVSQSGGGSSGGIITHPGMSGGMRG